MCYSTTFSRTNLPNCLNNRFGTLDALKSDDSDSDDETNRHYAGGSEHSGQLIKGNKDKVKVEDVFKSAREYVFHL